MATLLGSHLTREHTHSHTHASWPQDRCLLPAFRGRAVPQTLQPRCPARQQCGHRRRVLLVTARVGGVSNLRVESRGLTFALPVDYAQLLGLRGREAWLDSQVTTAYNELAEAQLEEGYTERAAAGRQQLLEEARASLLSTRGRPLSGTGPAPKSLTVSWDALPGALCLLREVGEHEVVLELGGRLLDTWESRQLRRDILLSMALAHCGLAARALDRATPALASARLGEAAQLLESAGTPPLAPGLQDNIRKALADLRPACVLDQLQLPLETQYITVRRQALVPLRALLLDAPPEVAKQVDEDFACTALERLTAEEGATLCDWAAVSAAGTRANAWATPAVLRRAALALLVAGFSGRRPSLIRSARSIYQRLHQRGNVAAELVVCHVLLGAAGAAENMLLSESRGRSATPPSGSKARESGAAAAEVLAYVRGASPDGGKDLLPGLVAFTETWLARVAFPSFRNSTERSASLVDYFDDARVTGWLAVHGEESDSPLATLSALGRRLQSQLTQLIPSSVEQMLRLPRVLPGTGAARQRQGAWALAATAAALGIVCLARPRLLGPIMAPSTSTAAAGGGRHWWGSRHAAPISPRDAKRTIQLWQDAKAAALGPRHQTNMLAEALAEPLLGTVRQQANTAAANGWFWTYQLDSIKVESVQPGPPPAADDEASAAAVPTALVTARLQEAADVWNDQGKKGDSYASTYKVEYTMVQQPNGSWRIARSTVLGR